MASKQIAQKKHGQLVAMKAAIFSSYLFECVHFIWVYFNNQFQFQWNAEGGTRV